MIKLLVPNFMNVQMLSAFGLELLIHQGNKARIMKSFGINVETLDRHKSFVGN